MNNYPIMVYQRNQSTESEFHTHKNVTVLNVPLIDISSTLIRKMISEKKSIRYLVPDLVVDYIQANHYYKK